MLLSPRPSSLTQAEFVSNYGHIYEHSAWIAERTWAGNELASGHDSPEQLARAMESTLCAASDDEKLALIRAHPDLAGRAAIANDLTPDSTEEQASAGIDQCTPDEYQQFVALNSQYKETFGFPFVMAVRGSNRHLILQAFRTRLDNPVEKEFATAISEINKIARLRLEQMAVS